MSLSEKMTALCRTVGIAGDVPWRVALDMMEKNMGLESDGSWPDRADRLMSAVGVTLDATPTAPVATPTAPVATPPAPATATPTRTAVGKRKSPPMGLQQSMMQAMPKAQRFVVPAAELALQRTKAAEGGAEYKPRELAATRFANELEEGLMWPGRRRAAGGGRRAAGGGRWAAGGGRRAAGGGPLCVCGGRVRASCAGGGTRRDPCV